MKFLLSILTILLSLSLSSQNDLKEWVKKNNAGVVIEKGTYKKGKQEGVWNYYYFDGRPSLKATYNDGVLDGKSTRYDLQGNIIAELIYVSGNLTGKQTYYYPTGQKLSEGEMINGKEEGAWKYYNQKGEFMGFIKYLKGTQVNEKSK